METQAGTGSGFLLSEIRSPVLWLALVAAVWRASVHPLYQQPSKFHSFQLFQLWVLLVSTSIFARLHVLDWFSWPWIPFIVFVFPLSGSCSCFENWGSRVSSAVCEEALIQGCDTRSLVFPCVVHL